MVNKQVIKYSWIWSFIGFLLLSICLLIIVSWLNKKDNADYEDRNLNRKEDNEMEKVDKEANKKDVKFENEVEFIDQSEKSESLEESGNKENMRPVFSFCRPASKFLPVRTNGKSIGESICCKVMEEMFKKPFKTVRPSFLRNPETNKNLELDCYNEEIGIAVEYNGIQHYKWPNFTRQTKEEFVKQLERDKMKVELCDRNNVLLITVPYTVKHEEIPNYLYEQVEKYYK